MPTAPLGTWWVQCCYRDLVHVESADDQEYVGDEELQVAQGPFATLREALEYLHAMDGAYADGPAIRTLLDHASCCYPQWDGAREAYCCKHGPPVVEEAR